MDALSGCLVAISSNVPGWNRDVREMHKAARRACLYWIDNHKPKSGPLFDNTKESTKEFKYAMLVMCKHRFRNVR